MSDAYFQLEKTFARAKTFRHIFNTLEWDAETFMPKGVGSIRAEQKAVLAETEHALLTDDNISSLLNAAQGDNTLTERQRRNLSLMRSRYDDLICVPSEAVNQRETAMGACLEAWGEAKKANDFQVVRPTLETLVALSRDMGEQISQRNGITRYQAWMNKHDPNFRETEIDQMFPILARELPPITDQIINRQNLVAMPQSLPPVPIEKQHQLAVTIATMMGFDFNRGRLDVSQHPFTGDMHGDTRITTRYDVDFPLKAIPSTFHEAGHGLYEQGLPLDGLLQPVGDHCGVSVHESQSLIFDKIVSRTLESCRWLSAAMIDHWGAHPAFSPENLYANLNQVKRGLIRVDADMVTYPLHVILRFGMERDLIEGRLEVKDIPERWNADMNKYLGITPPDDKQGCLQDIQGIIWLLSDLYLGGNSRDTAVSGSHKTDHRATGMLCPG